MACGMIGYCRICAQRNEKLVSVFGEDGMCLQLYVKLKVCLQMTVMKDDYLPTAVCVQCLTKLEACYQLFQLRLKGENELKSYQKDLIDLSNRSTNFQSVMHGEQKPWIPIKMEEDMSEHPKKRKMRRHMLGIANPPPPQNLIEPPQESQPPPCICDTCTHAKYGGLPLLAQVSSQQQVETNIISFDHPVTTASYPETESASNTYFSVQPSPILPLSDFGADQQIPSSSTPCVERVPSPPSVPSTTIASSTPSAFPKEDTSGTSTGAKKEIPCDFCGKTFTHTGDLNKHRRIHTGERPYKCTQCDRKFSHASNLLRHRKIHSGERPFTCSSCGKKFSRKDKMLSHEKSATCKRSDVQFQPPGSSGSQ